VSVTGTGGIGAYAYDSDNTPLGSERDISIELASQQHQPLQNNGHGGGVNSQLATNCNGVLCATADHEDIFIRKSTSGSNLTISVKDSIFGSDMTATIPANDTISHTETISSNGSLSLSRSSSDNNLLKRRAAVSVGDVVEDKDVDTGRQCLPSSETISGESENRALHLQAMMTDQAVIGSPYWTPTANVRPEQLLLSVSTDIMSSHLVSTGILFCYFVYIQYYTRPE